jgi:hypothetical protein
MNDQAPPAGSGKRRSRRGSIAIMAALSLTALLGFSALGTEIVYVTYKQRQIQSTATSAALAGATALMTGHPANLAVESRAVATMAGFTNGTGGVTVAVNHPPLAGSYVGNTNAVEVVISQPQTLPLSSLFYAGAWGVTARAVATQGNSASDCVLALDTGTITAAAVGNGAQVNLNQCGMAVDANGPSALTVTGGAVLTAQSVTVSGADAVNNGGSIVAANGVKTGQAAVANPYADAVVPTASGCKYGALPNSPLTLAYSASTQTLNADGVYCGGLVMGNAANVVMNPGVYIINGGTFSVQGGVTLSGTGVTIVLTGSGSNWATVSIANGSTVNLSAPTNTGLVFLQDPSAPTSLNLNSSFQGGASETLTGALYFPSQTVTYANGTSTAAVCTQLVAWQVVFQGGASFNSTCANTGVGTIGASPSQLVE